MEENYRQERQRTIDLSILLSTLKRSWLIAVCVAVIAGIIGFCYSTFFVTPMYRSSVKMLVDVKAGNSSYVTNEQVVVSMRLVETIRDLIVTDQILDPVIDELDLSESSGSLASKISVEAVEETQIININVTYNDPKIALGIVEEIMKTAPEQINQWFESGSGSIKVVSNPTSSSSPISPNVPRNTIIFTLAGFVAVLAVVAAKYLLNSKFNSADDITNVLGLNVLGVIPSLESLENRKHRKRRRHR